MIKSVIRSITVLDTMMEKMKTICFTNILISYCEFDVRKEIEKTNKEKQSVFIFSITVSNTVKLPVVLFMFILFLELSKMRKVD